MEINRHNYEMFFLLYADNELDAEERKAVEAFVVLHADLKEELRFLMQSRLPADETIPFLHKATLYKSSSSVITLYNYEEYFLLYADHELNEAKQKEVEDFIVQHPQKKAELTLLQRVKPQPDKTIVFINKHSLYRTEKTTAHLLSFQWRRMVAAAAIVAIGSWVWMNAGNIISRQVKNKFSAVNERLPAEKPILNENKQSKDVTSLTELKEAEVQLAVTEKNESANKNGVTAQKARKSSSTPVVLRVQPNSITNPAKIKVAVEHEPASLEEIAPLAIMEQKVIKSSAVVSEEVKPLILGQAAFHQEDNKMMHEAITKTDEGITYLDTDNTEKKSKGMFRGLIRKASRFVDHVTNPDISDKQSVVRVASFEITRK